jgi:prepilin-type N-terminal cleavage/methylation domain-containing protein
MKTLKDKRGVTLLELMVVTGIVGLLAAMAVPGYYVWLPKLRVNRATMALSDDLQMARMKAVSENVPYIVTFNLSENSYSVFKDADHNGTGGPSELVKKKYLSENSTNTLSNPGVVFGYNVTKKTDGTALGTGENAVFKSNLPPSTPYNYEEFRPDGTASFYGTIYLIPAQDLGTNRCDRGRAITIDQFTGLVRGWTHDNVKGGAPALAATGGWGQ